MRASLKESKRCITLKQNLNVILGWSQDGDRSQIEVVLLRFAWIVSRLTRGRTGGAEPSPFTVTMAASHVTRIAHLIGPLSCPARPAASLLALLGSPRPYTPAVCLGLPPLFSPRIFVPGVCKFRRPPFPPSLSW